MKIARNCLLPRGGAIVTPSLRTPKRKPIRWRSAWRWITPTMRRTSSGSTAKHWSTNTRRARIYFAVPISFSSSPNPAAYSCAASLRSALPWKAPHARHSKKSITPWVGSRRRRQSLRLPHPSPSRSAQRRQRLAAPALNSRTAQATGDAATARTRIQRLSLIIQRKFHRVGAVHHHQCLIIRLLPAAAIILHILHARRRQFLRHPAMPLALFRDEQCGQMSRAANLDFATLPRASANQGRILPRDRALAENAIGHLQQLIERQTDARQAAEHRVQVSHQQGSGHAFAGHVAEQENQFAILGRWGN